MTDRAVEPLREITDALTMPDRDPAAYRGVDGAEATVDGLVGDDRRKLDSRWIAWQIGRLEEIVKGGQTAVTEVLHSLQRTSADHERRLVVLEQERIARERAELAAERARHEAENAVDRARQDTLAAEDPRFGKYSPKAIVMTTAGTCVGGGGVLTLLVTQLLK